MKITTYRRNRIVEQNLGCVDAVIKQYECLLHAAHLEYDDVYQDLAVRLIDAVSQYRPRRGGLKKYIDAQLRRELWVYLTSEKYSGIRCTPTVFSLDEMLEAALACEMSASL